MHVVNSSGRFVRSSERVKGAGGLACLVFAAILGCAFWIGALLASHPLPH